MIFGTDFITKPGIKLYHDIQWYNSTPPMHLHKGLASDDFDNREDMYYTQFKDNLPDQDWPKVYVMEILDVMHH